MTNNIREKNPGDLELHISVKFLNIIVMDIFKKIEGEKKGKIRLRKREFHQREMGHSK